MKNKIYNIARKSLYILSLALSQFSSKGRLTGFILCYHNISNETWDFNITRKNFEKQIAYLSQNFQPFSVEMLEMYLQKKLTPKKPFFLITFDDGYKSVLELKSYLDEKGIKPIIFVMAEPNESDKTEMDNKYPLLSVEEIKELANAGWVIGCHSDTHPNFWQLDSSMLNQQITDSKNKLESKLGMKINYFAYPRGRYSNNARNLVKSTGYKMAFSMDNKVLTTNSDIFALPRIGIMNSHSFTEFKALQLPLSTKLRSIFMEEGGKDA